MRPIRQGDRGPAVEDVQRRLRALGADLGPSGVDGVFLGATLAAIVRFQKERGLREHGEVGSETWARLVDDTFALGDRLIYLHFPYFHGADVAMVQGALNAMGFAAGAPDGIFGAFSEHAVREFQANIGLPSDGIVGPETVRSVTNLRHVWVDKDPAAPDALRLTPVRTLDGLAGAGVIVMGMDAQGADIAQRLRNLARATDPGMSLFGDGDGDVSTDTGPALLVGGVAADTPTGSSPVVSAGDGGEPLAKRLEVALLARRRSSSAIRIVLSSASDDEHTMQRIAVGLLDGLCRGLPGSVAP